MAVLQIADFASVAAKLIQPPAERTGCLDCEETSNLPAWNGAIPIHQNSVDPCTGFMRWATFAPGNPQTSLNGSGITAAVYTATDLPTPAGGLRVGWRLDIRCKSWDGSPNRVVWYGYKSTGYTPKGTYIVDHSASDSGCGVNGLCTITIE
jgi:hypothetical protein